MAEPKFGTEPRKAGEMICVLSVSKRQTDLPRAGPSHGSAGKTTGCSEVNLSMSPAWQEAVCTPVSAHH